MISIVLTSLKIVAKKLVTACTALVICFAAGVFYYYPYFVHQDVSVAAGEASGPIIPNGTRQALIDAIDDVYELCARSAFIELSFSRPGGIRIGHTPEMDYLVAIGDETIPLLVANLKNANPNFRLQVIEMLGMLNAKAAVPSLLETLTYRDDFQDNLVVAKLSSITRHPDGYKFLRRWFDKSVQDEAVASFRDWIKKHPH